VILAASLGLKSVCSFLGQGMPSLAIVYRPSQALILPCKADLDLWFLFIIESAILNVMTEIPTVLFGS